jgi:hypothetical protein
MNRYPSKQGTYTEIQKWVKIRFGYIPKTCWIAQCKQLFGLPVKVAWNRREATRIVPCPLDKQHPIEKAFQHFGMLP